MKRLIAGALTLLPFVGALDAVATAESRAEVNGRDLYVERCGGCHLEGGFGTRVLQRRVPEGQAELQRREVLPSSFIVLAVRGGVGSMPQMRPAELSDADLSAISRYLEKPS